MARTPPVPTHRHLAQETRTQAGTEPPWAEHQVLLLLSSRQGPAYGLSRGPIPRPAHGQSQSRSGGA